MIRVDIETIIMAAGPVPSIIVLRERSAEGASDAPLRALSIQTGSFEAAAVGRGVYGTGEGSRPITHDLMVDVIKSLGGKLERVEIDRVDAPVFYATVVLEDADGGEKHIDARPSDALALAVRDELQCVDRDGRFAQRKAQRLDGGNTYPYPRERSRAHDCAECVKVGYLRAELCDDIVNASQHRAVVPRRAAADALGICAVFERADYHLVRAAINSQYACHRSLSP